MKTTLKTTANPTTKPTAKPTAKPAAKPTAKPTKLDAPSFTASGAAIVRQMRAADKAGNVIAKLIDAYIDSARAAGLPRNQQGVESLQKAIKECPPLLAYVAEVKEEHGADSLKYDTARKAPSQYAGSAARAFFFGVPYKARLAMDKAFYLPWSIKAGKGAGASRAGKAKPSAPAGVNMPNVGTVVHAARAAGPVVITNDAALITTLQRAVEQAKLVNRLRLHDKLIALCLEELDGFKVPSVAPAIRVKSK
jgi:hypothetical protein